MKPTRLTLGTVQLGMPYGVANTHGQPSRDDARAIVRAAIEAGIRSFDTAPSYGDAEVRLGEILAAEAFGDVHVTTKLPPLGSCPTGEVRRHVGEALDASLKRLGLEQVDCYLAHDPSDLRTFPEEVARAFEEARAAGKIAHGGASVYSPAEATVLLDLPGMSAVQLPYNLLDQRARTSGILARFAQRGFTVFARSAFLQGLFAMSPDALPVRVAHARGVLAELTTVLAGHRLSPMDAALAFVADTAGIDSVVLGVDTPAHISANAAAARAKLPAGLADELASHFSAIDLSIIEPSRWAKELRS